MRISLVLQCVVIFCITYSSTLQELKGSPAKRQTPVNYPSYAEGYGATSNYINPYFGSGRSGGSQGIGGYGNLISGIANAGFNHPTLEQYLQNLQGVQSLSQFQQQFSYAPEQATAQQQIVPQQLALPQQAVSQIPQQIIPQQSISQLPRPILPQQPVPQIPQQILGHQTVAQFPQQGLPQQSIPQLPQQFLSQQSAPQLHQQLLPQQTAPQLQRQFLPHQAVPQLPQQLLPQQPIPQLSQPFVPQHSVPPLPQQTVQQLTQHIPHPQYPISSAYLGNIGKGQFPQTFGGGANAHLSHALSAEYARRSQVPQAFGANPELAHKAHFPQTVGAPAYAHGPAVFAGNAEAKYRAQLPNVYRGATYPPYKPQYPEPSYKSQYPHQRNIGSEHSEYNHQSHRIAGRPPAQTLAPQSFMVKYSTPANTVPQSPRSSYSSEDHNEYDSKLQSLPLKSPSDANSSAEVDQYKTTAETSIDKTSSSTTTSPRVSHGFSYSAKPGKSSVKIQFGNTKIEY